MRMSETQFADVHPAPCARYGANTRLRTVEALGPGFTNIILMRSLSMVGKLLLAAAPLALLASAAFAAPPVDNVNAHKHPNIAAAQRLSTQAYEKIVAAQQANEWDMNGHAQKAKELLDQVNRELKEAAEAANANAHR